MALCQALMMNELSIEPGGGSMDGCECDGPKLSSCHLLPHGIWRHSVAAVKDCLYVFGGEYRDSSGRLTISSRMLKFEVGARHWTEVPKKGPWPGGLFYPSSCPHKSSIYVVGGFNELYGNNREVWRFDCETERFENVEKPLPNSTHLQAVVGDGKLYAIADGIWAMSLDSDGPWERLADCQSTNYHAAWIDGSIYVIDMSQSLLRYDVVVGGSGAVEELQSSLRGDFLNTYLISDGGNLLLMLASRDRRRKCQKTDLVAFDLRNKTGWSSSGDVCCIPPGLTRSGWAWLGDHAYVFGGMDSRGKGRNELWEVKLGPEAQDVGALTRLLEDLWRLGSSGELADVKFLVGAERRAVKGHVALLSVRCPILAALIKEAKMKAAANHERRCCHLEVDLPLIEPATFDRVLRYVYTSRVDRCDGDPSEMRLFNAASFFGLDGLRMRCADALKRSSGAEHAIERLRAASRLSLDFAQRFLVGEIVRSDRYGSVVCSPTFCLLGDSLVVEVVRQYGRLHGVEEVPAGGCKEAQLEVPE